jgi:hypothetical protein
MKITLLSAFFIGCLALVADVSYASSGFKLPSLNYLANPSRWGKSCTDKADAHCKENDWSVCKDPDRLKWCKENCSHKSKIYDQCIERANASVITVTNLNSNEIEWFAVPATMEGKPASNQYLVLGKIPAGGTVTKSIHLKEIENSKSFLIEANQTTRIKTTAKCAGVFGIGKNYKIQFTKETFGTKCVPTELLDEAR